MKIRESGMGDEKCKDACRIGELVADVVERASRAHLHYESVAEAWEGLLPSGLRCHCRLDGLSDGRLKVLADASSYAYELRLSGPTLLQELRRLCPTARVQRIEVAMAP